VDGGHGLDPVLFCNQVELHPQARFCVWNFVVVLFAKDLLRKFHKKFCESSGERERAHGNPRHTAPLHRQGSLETMKLYETLLFPG
jgi:hypothetical protein